jgi:hypothetical protein
MDNRQHSNLFVAAGIGTAMAVALVALVYGIAQAVDANLLVTSPGADIPKEVPIGNALGITVLGGVVGLLLAVAARRFTPRPRFIFLAVCLVLLVLDGITPFTASDETSTGVWLNAMHLVAAIPIVGSLFRALPERRSALKTVESNTRSESTYNRPKRGLWQ